MNGQQEIYMKFFAELMMNAIPVPTSIDLTKDAFNKLANEIAYSKEDFDLLIKGRSFIMNHATGKTTFIMSECV